MNYNYNCLCIRSFAAKDSRDTTNIYTTQCATMRGGHLDVEYSIATILRFVYLLGPTCASLSVSLSLTRSHSPPLTLSILLNPSLRGYP